MVYLIENLNNSTYKIGYSQNPNKRLQSLQTSTCDDLKLIMTISGDIKLEKILHSEFQDLHIKREWFKKSDIIFNKFLEIGANKIITEKEPSHILIYPQGLGILLILNQETKNLLFLILKTSVKSNIVKLTPKYKRSLYKELNISEKQLNSCIEDLIKYKVLLEDIDLFLINSEFFTRDTWGEEIYVLS